MLDRTLEQQIGERAYLLWEREGGRRGHIGHHWFQAVRDTLAEGAAASGSVERTLSKRINPPEGITGGWKGCRA